MSVTLFYCSECNRYTTEGATVKLEVNAKLNTSRRRLFACEECIWMPNVQGFSLEDIVRSECPECGQPTELMTLDECPHWWGKAKGSQPPYRVCALCDEEQEGRVVFDE